MKPNSTSILPLEVKAGVLALLPRNDLLQVSLVSWHWRNLAKANSRFFLVARFTSSAERPFKDVMDDFDTLAEYAIAGNFWLKIAFDAQRPARHKTMPVETWLEEGRRLVIQLCGLLPRVMPRTVSIYLAVSEALWKHVDQALTLCPAPVLRVLELSLPEFVSHDDSRHPKTISSTIFTGDAPFLRALSMSHFAIGHNIVAAFRRVRDLKISVNATDQCIHGHGVHAVKLALLFPHLKNLGIDVGEADDTGTKNLFDLTGLALRSIDTSLIGEDSPDPAGLLILTDEQLTNLPLSRISHHTEFVDADKLRSHLTGCQLGSTHITLNVMMDCGAGGKSHQIRQFYFAARAIGDSFLRERVFSGERDIYEPVPDLDTLTATALSAIRHNLVSLTVDMDLLSALHQPSGSLSFPVLKSLGIQVHSNWNTLLNDHCTGRSVNVKQCKDSANVANFGRLLFRAPDIQIIRLCAVGSSHSVASDIIEDLIHALCANAEPSRSRRLTLELNGMLLSTSQDTFFAKFQGNVSRTDRIVGAREMADRYGCPNVYMGDDFKDYGTAELYSYIE